MYTPANSCTRTTLHREIVPLLTTTLHQAGQALVLLGGESLTCNEKRVTESLHHCLIRKGDENKKKVAESILHHSLIRKDDENKGCKDLFLLFDIWLLLFKLNFLTKIAEKREWRTKVSLHVSRTYLTRFQFVRQICSRHVKSHFRPLLCNIQFLSSFIN